MANITAPLREINADTCSFDEWVHFIFGQPVCRGNESLVSLLDCEGSEKPVFEFSVRLFREPAFLLHRYSPAQLNQGFWYLPHLLNFGIWNEELAGNAPWHLRQQCVEAIFPLSDKLFSQSPFAREPLNSVCFMWWDLFRCFNCFNDEPNPKMVKVFLNTLTRILALPSEPLWFSALHGLGHLKHPGKKQAIEAFLARHSDASENLRTYARQAREGKVL